MRLGKCIYIGGLLTFAVVAAGTSYRPLTLQEKVSRADLIVVGQLRNNPIVSATLDPKVETAWSGQRQNDGSYATSIRYLTNQAYESDIVISG